MARPRQEHALLARMNVHDDVHELAIRIDQVREERSLSRAAPEGDGSARARVPQALAVLRHETRGDVGESSRCGAWGDRRSGCVRAVRVPGAAAKARRYSPSKARSTRMRS